MGVLVKIATWAFRLLGFLSIFGGLWAIDKYTGFTDGLAGFLNGLFGFQQRLLELASNASTYLDGFFSDFLNGESSSFFQFATYVISLDVAIDYIVTFCDFIFYVVFVGLGGGLITVAQVALVWYAYKVARKVLKSVAAGMYKDNEGMP